ncbi:hypothetical protein TSUD_119070 [Trifolium subterraneum]|uniref:NB-ARC domain-containing protein n=1 Tax=Trifolium subterraneum TaxID=3900 RepID=A0A2Z6NS92_TRISU|nr:hypothetical protein TSUD_119070 [Trifolium subterraneum]
MTLCICGLSVKSIDQKWLKHLISLQNLEIVNAPKLKSLPKNGLPSSLLVLSMTHCPLLEAILRRKQGKEWRKIAHIPSIIIDELYFVTTASAQSCCCEKPNLHAQPATQSIKCFTDEERLYPGLQVRLMACTKIGTVVKRDVPLLPASLVSLHQLTLWFHFPDTTTIDSEKEIIAGEPRTSCDYLSELILHNCFAAERLMQ